MLQLHNFLNFVFRADYNSIVVDICTVVCCLDNSSIAAYRVAEADIAHNYFASKLVDHLAGYFVDCFVGYLDAHLVGYFAHYLAVGHDNRYYPSFHPDQYIFNISI